jgi:uncharacterized protein YceH (UPF0502 family)
MDVSTMQTAHNSDAPVRQPLTARQRRVLGVLIEKAKTTPDAYPLTLNALVAGCNQKSNRSPVVNYTITEVEETLDQLRQLGAVIEVISEGGRVPRYKHRAYEWWGVTKEELAILAELLLRGEQTLGELRSHVARMEPIGELAQLKSLVDGLIAKNLVVALTPPGRGQVVCHALYNAPELQELQARYATQSGGGHAETVHVGESAHRQEAVTTDMFSELQLEVAELRAEVARLRQRLAAVETAVSGRPAEPDSSSAGPGLS